MDENIMVSVICNAYNHEKYIRDALEGFVKQKTSFKFEVLVHDDASTDRTADIIREYEKAYPELVKPIYQTENQYSKGGGIVGRLQIARVKGKYTAKCEGDDYWTDPYKLQKQFDAMEEHPEVDMCAHAGDVMDAATKKRLRVCAPIDTVGILPVEDVIMGGGGYVLTCSLFYRSCLDKNVPEFRKVMGLDYFMQIHGSLRGGILFLPDNMSVYRALADGSWSSRMTKDTEAYILHNNKVRTALEELDRETGYKYDEIIKRKILKNDFDLLIKTKRYSDLKKEPYKELYKKLSLEKKLKLVLKRIMYGSEK